MIDTSQCMHHNTQTGMHKINNTATEIKLHTLLKIRLYEYMFLAKVWLHGYGMYILHFTLVSVVTGGYYHILTGSCTFRRFCSIYHRKL